MPRRAAILLWLAAASAARAQHCGGPCEVSRWAAPVSSNPKFTMVEEKGVWAWAEEGKKRPLEKPLVRPPLGFKVARIFVSPAGNGFLVTGNAAARSNAPPLFVFCDPGGRRLTELTLEHGLTEEEQRWGPCPQCTCCKDILYVFAEDPHLSDNGCYVELKAGGTGRRVSFFLPLGAPVGDRGKFDDRLAELEWKALAPEVRERERAAIEVLMRDLDSEDVGVREKAHEGLIAKGLLARGAVRTRSPSPEVRERAAVIVERLKPKVPMDVTTLGAFASYDEEGVAEAARARLAQVLPPEAAAALKGKPGAEWTAWVERHGAGLKPPAVDSPAPPR